MTFLHILSMGFVLALLTMADSQAFAWMRGKKKTLDPSFIRTIHRLTFVGLAGLIATGLTMALPQIDYLVQDPRFLLKMTFVVILVGNSFFIGKLMHIAFEKPYAEITSAEKTKLFVSGALSTLSWVGAFAMGLILFA